VATTRDPLGRLRTLIGAWPETSERLSHGAPTWWGGRRTFAALRIDHHGEAGPCLWIKSTHEMQAELVEADPERFFVPPYMGVSGWVAVRLRDGVDWHQLTALLEEGYRAVAPRRALRRLEELRR
jgi:hypothetical protein